jgi:hypothetical protein
MKRHSKRHSKKLGQVKAYEAMTCVGSKVLQEGKEMAHLQTICMCDKLGFVMQVDGGRRETVVDMGAANWVAE